VPRYQRRVREVNESVLATYLSGANTRRIAGALRPLLKAAPLSKSAVSRVVGTLKSELATWEKLLSDAPPHGRERIIPSGTFEVVINLRANEFRIYASAEADEHRCFTGAMVSGA
jgi:hypothetical protein